MNATMPLILVLLILFSLQIPLILLINTIHTIHTCSFYKHAVRLGIAAGLESSENRCAGFRPLLLCECWQTT